MSYDLKADPQETTNLILEPAYQDRVEGFEKFFTSVSCKHADCRFAWGVSGIMGRTCGATNSKRSSSHLT